MIGQLHEMPEQEQEVGAWSSDSTKLALCTMNRALCSIPVKQCMELPYPRPVAMVDNPMALWNRQSYLICRIMSPLSRQKYPVLSPHILIFASDKGN